MKQIQFTIDAFGPDGLLKDWYEIRHIDGRRTHFVRAYGPNILIVFDDGVNNWYTEKSQNIILYRRTRTAEDVARDTTNNLYITKWEELDEISQLLRIDYVQAGMDEMTKP
jgi:hypothetical protein